MRALGLMLVFLSVQVHAVPAAADKALIPCATYRATADPLERPHVRVRHQLVTVDNRCNDQPGLVVVWRMYENSSETFWVPARAVASQWTLHTGPVRVWVRFHDGSGFTYRKKG
jgi:crotonobetainyl-CoA:carnitine CoA-transferase CaiB-like acyl-CoA transferase